MSIHQNLRQLRQLRGLTQEHVATQLGLTRQALSSYESGRTRPDVDTLLRLAQIYGTDLDGILYGRQPAQRTSRMLRRAGIGGLVLLGLLSLLQALCLCMANVRFPLESGQMSAEDLLIWEQRKKLLDLWQRLDLVLLLLCSAFLLAGLLLVHTLRHSIPLSHRALYAAGLAGTLLLPPGLVSLFDPVYPAANYLLTPTLLVFRIALCLLLDSILHFGRGRLGRQNG